MLVKACEFYEWPPNIPERNGQESGTFILTIVNAIVSLVTFLSYKFKIYIRIFVTFPFTFGHIIYNGKTL